jgi:hypothetical protein
MLLRLFTSLALLTPVALAQCVMCGRTAAAQNAARIQHLQNGIITLLIPPVLILSGFLILAYRRRNA